MGLTILKFICIIFILFYLLCIFKVFSLYRNGEMKYEEECYIITFLLITTIIVLVWALPNITNQKTESITSNSSIHGNSASLSPPSNNISNKSYFNNILPNTVIPVIEEVINSCGKSSLATNGNNADITCGNIIVHINTDRNSPQNPDRPIPITMILSREHQWVIESVTKVEGTTKGLEVLEDQLKEKGLQYVLKNANQVIRLYRK